MSRILLLCVLVGLASGCFVFRSYYYWATYDGAELCSSSGKRVVSDITSALLMGGWILFCVAAWTGQWLLMFRGGPLVRRAKGDPEPETWLERVKAWRSVSVKMGQIERSLHALAAESHPDARKLSRQLVRLKRLAIGGLAAFIIGLGGFVALHA